MIITITDESVFYNDGSVTVITGRTEDDQPVSFGADTRMAYDLYAAVQDQGEILAEVEGWQILGGVR